MRRILDRRVGAFCTATMLLFSQPVPADGAANRDNAKSRCTARTAEGEEVGVIASPPLFALLSHPEAFDGCKVVVTGFLGYNFPTANLYVSREDQVLWGALFGPVFISLRSSKSHLDLDKLKAAGGKIITVTGRFVASTARPSTIEDVERVTFIEYPVKERAP